MFIVDVADTKRLSESKEELSNLLAAPELANVPFVIMGNKIDKEGAVSKEGLKSSLGIVRTSGLGAPPTQRDNQPIEVFMCSVVKRAGYADGFRWLSNYL